MKLEYNGVELHLYEIHQYERDTVYTPDRTDVLYIRHYLNLTCVYAPGGNPFGMSVKKGQQAEIRGGALIGTRFNPNVGTFSRPEMSKSFDPRDGELPALTDKQLTVRLLQPRKLLKLTGYSSTGEEVVILRSEKDALNGPHPLGCVVVEPTGDAPNSLTLNFQIETHLRPVTALQDPSPIISHRWTSTVGHDDDNYPTRTINGKIVFDVGAMSSLPVLARSFISQLIPPIPLGFRRTKPTAELGSDGATITYAIMDTMLPAVFDAADSGATQCQIEERWEYDSPMGVAGGDMIPRLS